MEMFTTSAATGDYVLSHDLRFKIEQALAGRGRRIWLDFDVSGGRGHRVAKLLLVGPGRQRNRLVLKSMISTSTPLPFVAGVIKSLSMVPVRIPLGRRKAKSQLTPKTGRRIVDCELLIANL